MIEYIERLVRCGIPYDEALGIYKSMIKEYGIKALNELILDLERDRYVARV